MRIMTWLAAALAAGSLACAQAVAQKTSQLPPAAPASAADLTAVSQGTGCAQQLSPCSGAKMTLAQIAGYSATDPAMTGAYQPLDGDLTSLAAATGTNTLYYRSAANTWSPVVLGPNFAFSGGNLTIPGLPITITGDATATGTAGSGALALSLGASGVAAGTYGASGSLSVPVVTFDLKGRATVASSYVLGGAAGYAIGTSGSTIGLLNGSNTYSGAMTFTQTIIGSVSGNAGTATKLATPRAINGVIFDGSAPVTVPAVDTATPRLAAASNLSDVASVQAAARNLGLPWVVARSGTAASVTNTTAETTLATISIPAGAIGANGFVEVFVIFTYTNSANTKTFNLRLNGNIICQNTATTSATTRNTMGFNNAGSQTSQIGINGSGVGGNANAPYRISVDTTAATTLTITGQPGATSETVTLESYLVRITYGQ